MFPGWDETVESMAPRVAGSLHEIADANCAIFQVERSKDHVLDPTAINNFLLGAADRWRKKLSAAVCPWLFYSWYDGQADYLAFSAIPGRLGDPLPFGCETVRHSSPDVIAEAFAQGRPILWADLTFCERYEEVEKEPVAPFVLDVFVTVLTPL